MNESERAVMIANPPPGVPSTHPAVVDAMHTTAHAAVQAQRTRVVAAGFTGQEPRENFIK